MDFRLEEDLASFLDDDRRWRTAIVGGVAGGAAGAVGAAVPSGGRRRDYS